MYDEEFAARLTNLRMRKNVSARDMSLSVGQNPGYINSIETGKSLPSMSVFFFICDYLGISPKEFFDTAAEQPEKIRFICENLKLLTDKDLDAVEQIVSSLAGVYDKSQ